MNQIKTAKILAIIYICLIFIFSLDVKIFSIEFLIHLLPTLIFTICLIFAWSNKKIGGILFILSGLGTILVFNTYREFIPFIIISLIPLVVGVLFLLSKQKLKKKK